VLLVEEQTLSLGATRKEHEKKDRSDNEDI
jgi:hypothetical protein